MYQNMSTLSELKHKQQLIQQQIHDLKTEMDSFKVFIRSNRNFKIYILK